MGKRTNYAAVIALLERTRQELKANDTFVYQAFGILDEIVSSVLNKGVMAFKEEIAREGNLMMQYQIQCAHYYLGRILSRVVAMSCKEANDE